MSSDSQHLGAARAANARLIHRGLEVIAGTLHGIACDHKITQEEIVALANWLDLHVNLRGLQPFSEVWCRIEEILSDQIVTEEECEELLVWIGEYLDGRNASALFSDSALHRLQGFLQGLAIDNNVSEDEIRDLRDWLLDYGCFKDMWPFRDVWDLVNEIVSDGHISTGEREYALAFCSEFVETFRPSQVTEDSTESLRFSGGSTTIRSIQYILDDIDSIVFESKRFCITGTSEIRKRKDWHSLIEERGGLVHRSIVKNLDYLVLCGVSTPTWSCGIFGRKIEAVMERRRLLPSPLIVSEQILNNLVEKTV